MVDGGPVRPENSTLAVSNCAWELHEVDQPLERLFVGSLDRIVLPSAFYEKARTNLPQRLSVWGTGETRGQHTLIATPSGHEPPASEKVERVNLLGFVYEAQPRTHGVIRLQPSNLFGFQDYLAEAGEDLLSALRAKLRIWKEEGELPLDHGLIILLRIPKRREEGGPVEEVDIWAFATSVSILKIGEKIGCWEVHDGEPGLLIQVDESKQGEDVGLDLLNPTPGPPRVGHCRPETLVNEELPPLEVEVLRTDDYSFTFLICL